MTTCPTVTETNALKVPLISHPLPPAWKPLTNTHPEASAALCLVKCVYLKHIPEWLLSHRSPSCFSNSTTLELDLNVALQLLSGWNDTFTAMAAFPGSPANARVQSVKSLSTVSGYGKYGDSTSVSADHKSGLKTVATLTSQVTNLILKKLPHRTHHEQNKSKREKVVDTLANLQTMKSPKILCTPSKAGFSQHNYWRWVSAATTHRCLHIRKLEVQGFDTFAFWKCPCADDKPLQPFPCVRSLGFSLLTCFLSISWGFLLGSLAGETGGGGSQISAVTECGVGLGFAWLVI